MSSSKSTGDIRCTRRNFLPRLLQEIVVTFKSAQGVPAHQLSDLGSLSDAQLARIRPKINPSHQIRVINGQVCSQRKDEDEASLLQYFATAPDNLAVFNRINGQHTIADIAEAVAQELAWEYERAFAHTRMIFLTLASHLCAVPSNSPDLEREHVTHRNAQSNS